MTPRPQRPNVDDYPAFPAEPQVLHDISTFLAHAALHRGCGFGKWLMDVTGEELDDLTTPAEWRPDQGGTLEIVIHLRNKNGEKYRDLETNDIARRQGHYEGVGAPPCWPDLRTQWMVS